MLFVTVKSTYPFIEFMSHPQVAGVFQKKFVCLKDQFQYTEIHTWVLGLGDTTKEMNNTFLLFYLPKPCHQVWILVYVTLHGIQGIR